MKQISKLILIALAFGLALGVGTSAQAADKKPNVVMLMQDDTGWNDFGCYSGGGAALGHLIDVRSGMAHGLPAAGVAAPVSHTDVVAHEHYDVRFLVRRLRRSADAQGQPEG